MKTIKQAIACIAMGIFASSCNYETIHVSDGISTITYDFEDISALTVATGFKAYVDFSETEERVQVKVNDNLVDKVRIYKDGERLTVKLKDNINVKGQETLELYVTTAQIADFKVFSDAAVYLEDALNADKAYLNVNSGAYFEGDITAANFELKAASDGAAELQLDASEVYMDLSSGASVKGEIAASEARIKMTSDSSLDVFGSIDDLNASLNTGSKLEDYELEVRNLEITMSTDSRAYLNVSNTIDVKATTGAKLYYTGDADIVRQELSTDGRVIKKD